MILMTMLKRRKRSASSTMVDLTPKFTALGYLD